MSVIVDLVWPSIRCVIENRSDMKADFGVKASLTVWTVSRTKHNGFLGLDAITWDAVGVIKRKGNTMNSHIQQATSTNPGVVRREAQITSEQQSSGF